MVNQPDHKAGYFLVWVGWSGWGRWARNDDFSGEILFSTWMSQEVSKWLVNGL